LSSSAYVNDELASSFTEEALEWLLNAEECVLAIEDGGDFSENFDQIFRTIHSVKGVSKVLNLDDLLKVAHLIENQLQRAGSSRTMTSRVTSYFLRGIDICKAILEGKEVSLQVSSFCRIKNLK